MTMMESKAVIYTVLAIALGYFLISAVPERLEALQGMNLRGGAEEMEGIVVEAPKSTDSESLAAPDEAVSSLGDDVIAESAEPEEVALGGVREGALALGVWMINLMIALGVYFIVKRRLS